MKAIIEDSHADIFQSNEEVKEFCHPGQMADTCVWLLMGPKGWECCYYHKHPALFDRWKNGQTNAKRDGCDKIKNFHPLEHEEHKVIF